MPAGADGEIYWLLRAFLLFVKFVTTLHRLIFFCIIYSLFNGKEG